MSKTRRRSFPSVVLALGIAGVLSAASAFGAAVVQELKGDVRAGAAPAQSEPVTQNQRLLSGVWVTTAPASQVVLRFDDGQVVALHENTQFRIEDFRYRLQEPKADRAVFVLLKGASRFVTGALGERSPEAFSLVAPASTIGIRGTDFMVAVATPAAYLSVLKGTVTAKNVAGTAAFVAGTFGSLATSTTLAAPIPASALPAAVASAFASLRALPTAGSAADDRLGGTAAPGALGRETADKARDLKGDLGRELGKDVSDTARERARDLIPNTPSKSGRP